METLAIELIVPSKTNPRKNFDPEGMKELAESIRQKGILQPILVRPLGGTQFEIVAGERRYRAAKAAGLSEIPVIQRDLTDCEAMELQVIENLQRADLHPLEEADGYQKLLDLHGVSPDEIAAKVGKSKAYVYQRMKLLALSGEARKSFLAGHINPAVALVLARIPHKDLQNQALRELLRQSPDGESPSYREALCFVERNFMTRLKEAPFDTKDPNLISKAGACADCPKRTGNEKILFPDIEKEDVCTDPLCFQKKKGAAWVVRRDEALKNGWTVLEGEDADKICRYSYIDSSSGYVDLNAVSHSDSKKRTWKQMLKKCLPPVTLIRTIREEVYELLRVSELKEALTKAGYELKEADKTYERQKSTVDRKMIRIKHETCHLATSALVKKLESVSYGELVNLAVPLLIRTRGYNALWDVAKRRSLVESRKDDYADALKKELARLDESGLKGFLIELLVSGDKWSTWGGFSQNFQDACQAAGVDLKLAEKEAETALKARKNGRKAGGTK